MSIRLRLTIVAVLLAVAYLAVVPLVGYELNHREAVHNRALILRVAADEAANQRLVARLTADEATLKANTVATKKATCLAGNDYRMQDLALWHFIFTAFPNPHPTAEEARRTKQFLAFLAVHDKQRTC